jgi:hypothetical protein
MAAAVLKIMSAAAPAEGQQQCLQVAGACRVALVYVLNHALYKNIYV